MLQILKYLKFENGPLNLFFLLEFVKFVAKKIGYKPDYR